MAKKTIVNGVEGVISNATSQDLEFKALTPNMLVCYDRLTLVDYDHSPTSVHLGFKSGTSEFLLDGKADPGVGIPFSVLGKVFALGHYRPFARFVGATSGDKVALFAFGYLTDVPE